MKEFKVTDEILEIFNLNKITSNNIKKFIPDYLDYRREYSKYCNSFWFEEAGCEIYNFLNKSNVMTPKEFLNNIEDILEKHNILKNNEIYNFDGSDIEYGVFGVYDTKFTTWSETKNDLLSRICNEIRIAKKLKKEEIEKIQNIK